jgi:hypothetical protein
MDGGTNCTSVQPEKSVNPVESEEEKGMVASELSSSSQIANTDQVKLNLKLCSGGGAGLQPTELSCSSQIANTDQVKLNLKLCSAGLQPAELTYSPQSSELNSDVTSIELNRSPFPDEQTSNSLFSDEALWNGRRTSATVSQRR